MKYSVPYLQFHHSHCSYTQGYEPMATFRRQSPCSKMDRSLVNSPTLVAARACIVWLWLDGASARAISRQTGASLSTVYRWVRRWQEEGTVETKPYHRRLRRNPWSDSNKLLRAGTPRGKNRNKLEKISNITLGKETQFAETPIDTTAKVNETCITSNSACSSMVPLPSVTNLYKDTSSLSSQGHSHPVLLYDTLPQYYQGLMYYYNRHII